MKYNTDRNTFILVDKIYRESSFLSINNGTVHCTVQTELGPFL